jgi:hypothetical protein
MLDSGVREQHFVDYLLQLIRLNPQFKDATPEARIASEGVRQGRRADIAVSRVDGRDTTQLLIECKRYSVLSGQRLKQVLEQLDDYASAAPDATIVLAFPGRLDDESRQELSRRQVEAWDLRAITRLFANEIPKVPDPYFQALFGLERSEITEAQKLIQSLRECPPGNEGWVEYQRLIGKILNYLFCPPLTPSLGEHADSSKVNRRDFIFPNYASSDFWHFMRSRYAADYVVVDAKNSKNKITKAHVLQVANYLKHHGVGMFGMIICREGADGGATVTLREQWVLHNKLIAVVSHKEVEAMLLAKDAHGDPAAVLSDLIQQFRLSM